MRLRLPRISPPSHSLCAPISASATTFPPRLARALSAAPQQPAPGPAAGGAAPPPPPFTSPPGPLALLLKPAPFRSLTLCLDAAPPPPPAELSAWLALALPAWRAQGVNTVWATAALPRDAPSLAALTAPGLGFTVHHAKGTSLTLMRWLPEGACKVPAYGGTQVGVGGVVVDGQGRLLLVRERAAAAHAWKFPGGLSDPGEDVAATAVREVWEETGVRTAFAGLLSLRHTHRAGAFGVSDLYALALLRLEGGGGGEDAARITVDPGEIAEGKWMCGREFAEGTPHPLLARTARAALRAARGEPGALMYGAPAYSKVTHRWAQVFTLDGPGGVGAAPEGAPPPPVAPPPWGSK